MHLEIHLLLSSFQICVPCASFNMSHPLSPPPSSHVLHTPLLLPKSQHVCSCVYVCVCVHVCVYMCINVGMYVYIHAGSQQQIMKRIHECAGMVYGKFWSSMSQPVLCDPFVGQMTRLLEAVEGCWKVLILHYES